jgi:DNA-binding MarR family transcriptional regulator
VKASTATRATVSPQEIASDLMRLWGCVARGTESAVFELIERLELTLTQMKTLQTLAHCEEELSLKALSERLGLSLPATSRTVDGLLRRGLLERHEDERDRRVKRVRITDDGRDTARRVLDARLAGLEDFAASLSPEQRSALHAVLATIEPATQAP